MTAKHEEEPTVNVTELRSPNNFPSYLQRLIEISDAITKVGLPLVLLVVGLATYYGWIVSPLTTATMLEKHDGNMGRLLDAKERIDTNVLAAIQAMRLDMERNSKAYRVRICSEIRDVGLRTRCMDS